MPDLKIKKNHKVDFSCPSCNQSIKSERCELYSKLILKVDEYIRFDILFSNICGEHKTHLVTQDDYYLSGEELHDYIKNNFSTKKESSLMF